MNKAKTHTYEILWQGGERELVKGATIAEALMNAGYSHGAMSAMDSYKEIKQYKVSGYIPAGGHRMKLVEEVVDVPLGASAKAAIGAWLMKVNTAYNRKEGSRYEIDRVEEL